MSIAAYSKFNQYKNKIHSLSAPTLNESLMNETFLLEKDSKKKLEIYYAPFEHLNEQAKVVIVGITPGLHQMKKSFETVWNLKDENLTDEEVLHEVKKNSSFEGPMRKNLINMLDELNLPNYIGITSTSELFESSSHLVQTTSVLPYPVFYNGKNYSGSTPNIVKTDVLRELILQSFPKEMEHLNNPLIVPLGVNVSKALTYLSEEGLIDSKSILNGFPHPSGGNGHRHRQFAENKQEMVEKMDAYFNKVQLT
ncbi:uracil-DNA glycosylase family protein [Rossellomorea sp. FM04394]|uniref:uracil-DNA glycosylase family protein n=1 Tax=Rossellomorea sp. FM04394 TaxID=3243076 RepID=UPI0035A72169